MNLEDLLVFLVLFFSGILAGVEIVIHFGLRNTVDSLDEKSQLIFRQSLILKLRIVVPAIFIPMLISAALLTFFLGTSSVGFLFRILGLVSAVVWVLIRIIGTVPINSATLSWNPESPPKDWKKQIEKAERFHIGGVIASVLVFIFFLLSFLQP